MKIKGTGTIRGVREALRRGRVRFGRDESGAILPVAVLLLGVVLGLAALVVDIGHGYVLRDQLQVTADAAALAGVSQISNSSEIQNIALDFATKNMSASLHGTVLEANDVVPGTWDTQSKTFAPGGAGNAVQVTARRADANGNAVTSFFAGLVGLTEFDVAAASTAYANDCYQDGVIAGNQVQVDQNSVVQGNLCIYGFNGVHFDMNATIEPGAKVAAYDTSQIQFDQGASIAPGSIVQADITPTLANDVAGAIDDYEAGLNLPDQITSVVTGNSVPDSLITGTMYIVNGDLELDKNYSATDVVIAVRGNLIWGKNGVITNNADCASGTANALGLMATGNINLGKDSTVTGASIVAGNDVSLDQGSNTSNVSIHAGNDIQLDQNANVGSTCGMAFPDSATLPLRLVL